MPLLFEPPWEPPSEHICCDCGHDWVSLRALRALMPELKACRLCLTRAGRKALNVAEADGEEVLRAGRRAMRIAANITLSMAPPPKMALRTCKHCGGPVLSGALWCAACETDRIQYGSPPAPAEELVN